MKPRSRYTFPARGWSENGCTASTFPGVIDLHPNDASATANKINVATLFMAKRRASVGGAPTL
jgi:hypothetical protein